MLKGRPPKARPKPLATCEQNRDIYGFMVRPQHLERYKEHATIYKEEEEERSDRWEQFLSTINENAAPSPAVDRSSSGRSCSDGSELEDNAEAAGTAPKGRSGENGQESGKHWGQLRKSLWAVERASSLRGRGLLRSSLPGHDEESGKRGEGADGSAASNGIPEAQPDKAKGDGSGEDSEDEFCDATEGMDFLREAESPTKFSSPTESPWEEELRSLVRGGVPMALRGELWQVFVGTKTRRIRGHYNALLTLLGDGGGDSDGVGGLLDGSGTATANYMVSNSGVLEKWTNQIEKDLPRTFPGHPALDEDGRNTLRRLLTAYARHNPAVGYCQAMNFLAGLLLLLMPEENAFWTLAGIIEDNFEGYYSEKMVEAQVDQLIFDDLVREKFPKLANHLDALGVQVAWVSGPWFLSMFVNILPWESVLRVWDVLLYEGNRSTLFRTGLALMEMHAPALSATRDAGDAVAMLQAMATDTFDSSQLVLTACMGFQSVTESRLQELHIKHGPTVLAALQERSIELHLWRNSNSAITEKLPYLYKEEGSGDPLLIKKSIVVSEERSKSTPNGSVKTPQHDVGELDQSRVVNVRGPISFEESSLTNAIGNSIPLGQNDEDHADADAKEQVAWLKNELSRELEEKKAALLRATELETAFMELVKEDNRRLLSAKVEKLEAEVGSLKQQLSDKKEQEQALVEVLVRMEQEQKIADDARRFAELDSTAQRRAAEVFQEKYEGVADALGEMEKRAVMAESMLEATLSYQALGNNSPTTSGPVRSPVIRAQDSSTSSALTGTAAFKSYMNGANGSNMQDYDDHSSKQGVLNRSFGLNWRDRSKARSGSLDSPFRTPAQASEHSQEPELTSQPASELSTQ